MFGRNAANGNVSQLFCEIMLESNALNRQIPTSLLSSLTDNLERRAVALALDGYDV